jgi:amino acid adenylation domain-containing protein
VVIGECPLLRAPDSFVPFASDQIEQSIGRRFEQQVRAYPEKTAVTTTLDQLTYEQLNVAANRIAHAMLSKAGDTNEPVALFVGRESLIISAILGTLKAGKIYVPLDVADSAGRNATVLSESGARLLLTDRADLSQAERFWKSELSVLDLRDLETGGRADDPGLDVPPDAFAYIFYTSGSTGRPKGVVDTHRNVLHNILRYTNSLKISPEDRLTLLQSASFSGSVSSLFCALLNGATSYPFDLRREGAPRLVSWLADEALTMFHAVPSIFRLIATGQRQYPSLRVIRLEGDRARPLDIELYKKHMPNTCMLVNGLGATECGLVRQFFVDKSTSTPAEVVPIGQAVQEMRALVLDDSGSEAATDVVGEIAIESEFLAHGYWQRPDLTEKAFRPSSNDPRKRVYRTGDLGRMRADGCLDYLGRKTFQLKIRGMWVEVAAVEKALHELGGFREAIVHTHEAPGAAEPVLVAYLVAASSPAPSVSSIRRHLVRSLAEHMVPSAYVFLERLPLDANGKVDRKSLPAPGQARPQVRSEYVVPAGTLELQLQHIWQDVLQVRPIGIRDDFFELGGDSLQALRMLAAVEHATQHAVPPDVVLAGPTIANLSAYLQTQTALDQRAIVEVQKGAASRAPFFFLHGDLEAAGFYSLRIARALGADQPFFALPPCGKNGYPVPGSYEQMAQVHLRALRDLQPHGPYMLGGTCNGGLVAFEMARQLVAQGERVEPLILIGSTASNLRFRAARGVSERLYETLVVAGRSWAKLRRMPSSDIVALLRRRALPRWLRATDEKPACVPTPLHRAFQRIDYRYMPQEYTGPVTLIWARGEVEPPDEALRWWKRVAPDVRMHLLPGRHHEEAVTEHAEEVARVIKLCLNQAGESRE